VQSLVRQVGDVGNLAFIIALPVVIYLVFGSGAAHGEEMVGRGNIQFYVMVSMAVYGASVATTSIAAWRPWSSCRAGGDSWP
jgi:ABC-2 type transport system permease protein